MSDNRIGTTPRKPAFLALSGMLVFTIHAWADSATSFGETMSIDPAGISEYHENGRLVARVEYSGQVTLFGITPEHAAEVTWSEAPEYMRDGVCSFTYSYEFDFNDFNNHIQHSVALTSDGAVVYDNVMPSAETAAYFKKLAELAACRKATS
jgi:hypothetical protein